MSSRSNSRTKPGLSTGVKLAATLVATLLATGGKSTAQHHRGIPAAITTPDKVETRIGTLDFKDGAPSKATLERAYDQIDFTHAYNAFVNTMQGVSLVAAHRGFLEAGVKDNEILIFSELMDAKSLFLTANADTVYFLGFIDVSKGPMVFEVPPKVLGALDDMWFRLVTDFGLPGPDRGLGGKYLILPPGYDGPVPEGGYSVARSRTNKLLIMGRAFLENKNDPKPAVESIKKFTRLYPYDAGGVGTPIAEFLSGKAKLGKISDPPATVFHEGSGKVMNTVPPNDWSFYEMLSEIVQQEPATSLDPEQMGSVAALGIIKGKPFAPDVRMKKILTEALAVANATSRTLFMNPRDPSWYYYPNSAWWNSLFVTGYEFETPIPMIEGPVRRGERIPEAVKPFPPTGYRTLDGRTLFFYGVTGITPAMAMRMTGIGSQYLLAMADADKNYFDGSRTYKVTLPKGIPEANFWSLTLYDNQTRSMLDTPQGYPRAGSQKYPSPAAEANSDGTTTVYFGPTQPAGVKRGNWVQTTPGRAGS